MLPIWDSVLIVKKEGTPDVKDLSGVLAAAKKYKANKLQYFHSDKHVFGFNCTDWNGFDEDKHPYYKFLPKDNKEKLRIFYIEHSMYYLSLHSIYDFIYTEQDFLHH